MASATFELGGWDEERIDDEDPKVTRVKATKSFSGDVEGTSTIAYVMSYADDGTATVVGIERLSATVDGRSGTLVLRHVGRFADGAATADIEVIPTQGTHDFAGVAGTGSMKADPAGAMELDLRS